MGQMYFPGEDPKNDELSWGCIFFTIIIGGLVGCGIYWLVTYFSSSHEDEVAVEEVIAEEAPAVEDVITPPTTYLQVSNDDITFSADGGSREITVVTDGDWDIYVNTADWGHLSRHAGYVTLRVDPNSSSSSRTDYFVLRAGSITERINITQYGDTSPKADIESIWVDHNVYQNGQKGMRIHVEFTVDNMNGKTIYCYAHFYYDDNVTPLHDSYGNNLSFSSYGTSNYDVCRFEDFQIFVPHNGLNIRATGSVKLSFDISIRTSSGTELDRYNNTQFTFTRN